jgi:heme exporter protein CcmD
MTSYLPYIAGSYGLSFLCLSLLGFLCVRQHRQRRARLLFLKRQLDQDTP